MTTSGAYQPAYGRTAGAFTRIYDYGIRTSTTGSIVHEGFHSKQEWTGGLQNFGYPLGQEPYRSGHEVPIVKLRARY